MNRDKLITDNLPFVTSIAKQYVGKGIELEDLISEGTMGLIQAAGRYDESRGYSFISYAVWWVRQAIKQAIAEQSRIVRVPAKKAGQVNRINRLRAIFEQEHGLRPNINEMAEASRLTEHNVKDAMSASTRNFSVDAPVSERSKSTLLDILQSDEEPTTDASVVVDTLRAELRHSISLLGERERNVLSAFYGIDEPEQTFAEIGARYGMSRERARQIRKKAVRHLRSKTTSKVLRTYLG